MKWLFRKVLKIMKTLSQSQEDYLEEIYKQVLKNGHAKVTDISNALNVKKASVTGALIALADKKLINYEPYSKITITKEGEELAKKILNKHEILCDFFENVLGLTNAEASENACRMEHIVSEKFFNNFLKFSDYIREYGRANPDFIEKYKDLI